MSIFSCFMGPCVGGILPDGRTCPFPEVHPVRWLAVGTSATPKAAVAGAWSLRPRGMAAGRMVERSAGEHTMAECGNLGQRAGV